LGLTFILFGYVYLFVGCWLLVGWTLRLVWLFLVPVVGGWLVGYLPDVYYVGFVGLVGWLLVGLIYGYVVVAIVRCWLTVGVGRLVSCVTLWFADDVGLLVYVGSLPLVCPEPSWLVWL